MKLLRILIYEGSDDWLKSTQTRSLKDGINEIGTGNLITSYFIGETDILGIELLEIKEQIEQNIERES